MTTTLVWFKLVDSDGNPFDPDGNCSAVLLPTETVIANFKPIVRGMYADNDLAGIRQEALKVYQNQAALGGEPLGGSVKICNYGKSEQEPLIVRAPPTVVVVPATGANRTVQTSSSSTVPQVGAKRPRSTSAQKFSTQFQSMNIREVEGGDASNSESMSSNSNTGPSNENGRQTMPTKTRTDFKCKSPGETLRDFFESVVDKICQSDEVKKIQKISDSLENLSVPSDTSDPAIKLAIQHRNGIFDPLTIDAKVIYDIQREMSPEYMPPWEKIQKKNSVGCASILIGTSGCGKTRTCVDYGCNNFSLYFDLTKSQDFDGLLLLLDSFRSMEEDELKTECGIAINALIFARMALLTALRRSNSNLTPAEWIGYQRGRHTGEFLLQLFDDIQEVFSKETLKWTNGNYLPDQEVFTIIVDEAQLLLGVLKDKFSPRMATADGKRSFYSFMVQHVHKLRRFRTIWCGTHLRLRDVSLFESALGGKPDEYQLFSSFDYMKPFVIKNALRKWIRKDLITEEQIETIAFILQGRPRFLMQFMVDLCNEYRDSGTITQSSIMEKFDAYRRDMTTNNIRLRDLQFTLYNRYKEVFDISVKKFDGREQTKTTVGAVLMQCLIGYYFHEDTDKIVRMCAEYEDIVSTGLIMVQANLSFTLVEPLSIIAIENYLEERRPNWAQEHFARDLFADFLSESAKGSHMALFIALRFHQKWWKKSSALISLLSDTKWSNLSEIDGPISFLDCRNGSKLHIPFINYLNDPHCTQLLFPSTFSGPDIAFKNIICCIKTKWTGDFTVDAKYSKKNVRTMSPENWFRFARRQITAVRDALFGRKGKEFIRFRIELPFPSRDVSFEDDIKNGIICIDLRKTQLARDLLGDYFYDEYCRYLNRKNIVIEPEV